MSSKIPSDYKYNGLTYKEWIDQGRAHYVTNGGMSGWENRFWVRPDGEQIELYSTKRGSGPKKTPDDVLAVGGHMKPRKTSVRTNFGNNRKGREQVPERLRERFDSDEAFEQYKQYVRRGNALNQKRASLASKGGTKFNKGHIVAVGAGGSHDPMAQRLESEAGNKSTQNIAEIPRDRLAATGTPRDWDEAVTYYLNPELVPTELTPKDKQRIWSGEDPDIVYREADARIKANSNARPNRNRLSTLTPNDPSIPRSGRRALSRGAKWIPLAGIPLALADAGNAFAQGNYAEGAAHTAGAVVGELPGGDAVVESVVGTGVSDGTVTGVKRDRQQRPSYYGQQGPDMPSPEASNRAALLRRNPSSERGYETLLRKGNDLRKSLMSLFGR